MAVTISEKLQVTFFFTSAKLEESARDKKNEGTNFQNFNVMGIHGEKNAGRGRGGEVSTKRSYDQSSLTDGSWQ